jgi:signal transduction histidine kinase
MVLLLLVLFLAALNLVNLILLVQARGAMASAARERALALAALAVKETGAETLMGDTLARRHAGADLALRRQAQKRGFRRFTLLDPVGRSIDDSTPIVQGPSPRFGALGEDSRAALAAGRPVAGAMDPARGGEEADLAVFQPLIDSSGKIVAFVEAVLPVPELGRLESSFRLVLAIQVAGVLLIVGLVVLFANWLSRPYRTLAAAIGEAGLAGPTAGSPQDPDDLASAFRAVVAKLREQEEALGALGREGGGLGELVRFASGAARDMTTGVLVVDRQGRVAGMNPSARLHLGCGETDPRGLDLAQVAAAVEGLGALVRVSLEQGKGASREVLPFRTGDGRTGHLGIAVTPAAGSSADPVGALVLTTDLTEIRQLQEQARLRENLAAVGELSAGIAHEFRNALGTILGYARMLEKREDPRVRGPAQEILREVDAVRGTVDEFLLYARPPAPGRLPVDLGALLRSFAAVVPAGVSVEVAGEFGAVLGDEGLLRRAFGNLIQNAADASAEANRTVRVHIDGRRVAGGRMLQVEVDDDGPGIPAERRTQVFVPFFTTRARGTGLGLALVQRTVVDMGGTVEAGEGPRGGALFRIRLPLAPAAL